MGIKKPSQAESKAREVLDKLSKLPKKKVAAATWMEQRDKEILEAYFRERGMKLSGGLNMIIREFIIAKGLE
jgi:hypothetical protein